MNLAQKCNSIQNVIKYTAQPNVMHSVPNIKTHAHTMDNLSKVLCMCQNPFDTRKFTSLVPNCYFFVSLPGQTCCFRGVNIFYVKLIKQFTKKLEFTIIHFPCPVKCRIQA